MVVAGCCIRSQSADEIVPRYSVNGPKDLLRERLAEKGWGWGRRWGWGVVPDHQWSSGKNLNGWRDLIAKQRLVNPDGPDIIA